MENLIEQKELASGITDLVLSFYSRPQGKMSLDTFRFVGLCFYPNNYASYLEKLIQSGVLQYRVGEGGLEIVITEFGEKCVLHRNGLKGPVPVSNQVATRKRRMGTLTIILSLYLLALATAVFFILRA